MIQFILNSGQCGSVFPANLRSDEVVRVSFKIIKGSLVEKLPSYGDLKMQ